MVAGLRPMLLGGWSNKALDSKLQFDDCTVRMIHPLKLMIVVVILLTMFNHR